MTADTKPAWLALWPFQWSMIPLEPRGKHPLLTKSVDETTGELLGTVEEDTAGWKPYQTAKADNLTIRRWLQKWPDCNPGIVTGKTSGIVVMDIDGALGKKAVLSEAGGVIPATPVGATARGQHYFFKYPDLPEGKRVKTDSGILQDVDIRGDGGYVVAPGAVHPSGKLYHWELSPEDAGGFAEMPQWLYDLVVVDTVDPMENIRPVTVPHSVATEGYDHARKYALAALAGEVAKVEAARDGAKHDRLIRSACALAGFIPYLFAHEIEDALYHAVAYRADDKRAARKCIRDGISYGERRPRDIPEPTVKRTEPAHKPTPTEEWTLPPTEDGEPQYPQDAWTPRPLSALKAVDEDALWVWEGYIARGNATLISGIWKSGKTTLMSHILHSLGNNATEFVGLKVSPSKVLLVTEENEGHWATRRDGLSIGDHIEAIVQPMEQAEMLPTWTRLINRVGLEVGWRGYDVVVIDTLHNLWDIKDESDNAAAKEAVRIVTSLASKLNIAVVLMGHTTKSDPGFLKANRGAGSPLGLVDIIAEFRLYRPEDIDDTRRVLNAKSRFASTPTELVVEYDPMWGYAPQGTKADAARAERVAALMQVLPTQPPGYTSTEIYAEWPNENRPPKGTITADLTYLASKDARVLKQGQGNAARYWFAPENEQWQRRE